MTLEAKRKLTMNDSSTQRRADKAGKKYVYFFSAGFSEGSANQRALLGGKGANLAEMCNLGIPVPPGFTVSTEACIEFYKLGKKHPPTLQDQMKHHLSELEKVTGKTFGGSNPLLVSVRSGAAVSMPGMMDTVLNLGLNDKTVTILAERSGNERFAYDSYRRFIQMFSNVVLEIPHGSFEHILDEIKKKNRVKQDTELKVDVLKELIVAYKKLVKKESLKNFPQDALSQMYLACDAVFNSWNNERAITYRNLYRMSHDMGTAVNVQAMVFGNMGETSGTGVAFTRDPGNGKKRFFGEYLVNAQGEDVVAGIRTPVAIDQLKKNMPGIYKELEKIYLKLENHYRDMQDIEFTFENKKLYLLQTRNGKRTALAAINIACDMVEEGLINREEALKRLEADQLNQLLHPMIDPQAKLKVIAKGLPASPGAAVGKIVFDSAVAIAAGDSKKNVILVRHETSPEDVGGMAAAQGILTATGGMTSHAAVVARGMGKCCVAGCSDLHIDTKKKQCRIGPHVLKEGDTLSLNGSTGQVILGAAKLMEPQIGERFKMIMDWSDQIRTLKVRTNADTPQDAKKAREFGAEGIGLCRTEHMFFGEDRLKLVRSMILADDEVNRRKVLNKLEPLQKSDFKGIFEAMDGYPVTIRLLDPPLHEFLPHSDKDIKKVAKDLKIQPAVLEQKVKSLHELNPMLGHRGCRLAITYPEIYEMQTQAIIEAACDVEKRKGKKVNVEIMVPLVGIKSELEKIRAGIERVAQDVLRKKKVRFKYKIGTMIEIPRAAVTAGEIAQVADFFSFGTNDLTQMSFGFSRDDVGKFLPDYLKQGVLKSDPFATLDQTGVGALILIAVQAGRATNARLKLGICGEHGGDPQSIDFCHRAKLDYVSCSPFRVPIARLAAAQAAIRHQASSPSLGRH